jgi:hypothetical protein
MALKLCSMAESLKDGVSAWGSAIRRSIYQPCEATMPERWESPRPRQPHVLATMPMQRSKRVSWRQRPWNLGLVAVVTIVVLTCWNAFSDRHATSFLGSIEPEKTIAMEKQVALLGANAVLAKERSRFQTVRIPAGEERSAILVPDLRLARQFQVVHLGEDVTVRYFTRKPASHVVSVGQYQVVHLGEDVTVRYFVPVGRNTRN